MAPAPKPLGDPAQLRTLGTPAWGEAEYDPTGREDFAGADALLGFTKQQRRRKALEVLSARSKGTDLQALKQKFNANMVPGRDPMEEIGDYFLPGSEIPHSVGPSYFDKEKDRVFINQTDLPPEIRERHKDLLKSMPVEGIDIPRYSKISPKTRELLEQLFTKYQLEKDARSSEDPEVLKAISPSEEPRQ